MRTHIFIYATLAALSSFPEKARAVEVEGLPKVGESRAAAFAKITDRSLANGLRVIVIERPGLPLFCAEMLIQSGAETDPPRLAGLAHFTASLLTQGTVTRTAPQIANEIEALGAKLEAEGRWDATSIKLIGLSAQIAPAFSIFADVVRRPIFAPAEIERARRQASDDLRLALEEPGAVAALAASGIALAATPYAHPKSGNLSSLARLSREEIVAHHHRAFRPKSGVLVIAGNVTAADAFELAEKNFGDWTESAPSEKTPAKAQQAKVATSQISAAPAVPRAIWIDMPNAGQAAVYATCSSIPRTAPDYFAGKVANVLLGGGYSSRLNEEIRVKRGLSYGATSALDARRSAGLFAASAQTKNESAAEVIRAMQTEIARLGAELAPDDYLTARKSVLTGTFARDLETNEGYVKRVGELALFSLPLDALAHFRENIESVSAEDLRTFAAAHLRAHLLSFVVAGRAKDAAGLLREILPTLEVVPQREVDFDSPTLRKLGSKKP